MSVNDEIRGKVKCPFCGEIQEISVQTKSLNRYFNTYTLGTVLKGGPFLNGEYPISHDVLCIKCNKEFNVSFFIENQVITDFESYKPDKFFRKNFDNTIDKDQLISFIRKNCITTLLIYRDINDIYDYGQHYSKHANFDFDILLDYISMYAKFFNEINSKEVVNTIFSDLDNELNIQYLQEVNIDFFKFEKLGKEVETPLTNVDDEYSDIISHLQIIVKDNMEILKAHLLDYIENIEQRGY